jgi:hypothetical protein
MRNKILVFILCLFTTSAFADQITFCVDMSCNPNSFTQPYISGTFNNWCGDCDALTDQGNDIWCVTIDIDGPIEYKFTYDNWSGQEQFSPGEACTVTNFNFTNRHYVPAGDATVNYAWNSCAGSCPSLYDVEFCVDLSCNEGNFTQAYMSGTFNGWSGIFTPLIPQGGGIYCKTLTLPDGYALEYKFTLDDWAQQEEFEPGSPCTSTSGPYTNRFHLVSGDENLFYGWNSCGTNCLAYYNVEFCVDASCIPQGFNQLYVSGDFNYWSGDGSPLTHQGNNIYCGTFLVQEGDHEFLFTADNWNNLEAFVGGEPCTNTTYGHVNRTLSVYGDMTYSAAWSFCESDCSQLEGGDVEFCVCMEGVPFNYGAVYVSGTFNGWSGTANMLFPQGNTGKWCTTLNLPPGQIQYRFTTDNWANRETLNLQPYCTTAAGQFVNRFYNVNGNGSVSYVWENCGDAGLPPGVFNMDLGFTLTPGYVNGGLCSGLGEGGYEITSSGVGNSYNQDNQHILFGGLCGDGEAYGYVADISPQGWAGIGMRESGNAGSRKVELVSNKRLHVQRRIRTQTNGYAFPQQLFRPNHHWLKVVRQGDTFSGYTSPNGVNWSFAFSTIMDMPPCVLVYAFTQSNSVAMSPTTATFESLTVNNYLALAQNEANTTQGVTYDEFETGLLVYPNPATDLLKIESKGLSCEDCMVSLYNSLGQQVKMIASDIQSGSYLEVDVSGLEPGVYMIKVEGTKESIMRKVIVQRRN